MTTRNAAFSILLLLLSGISACNAAPRSCFIGTEWIVDQHIIDHIPMQMKFQIERKTQKFEAKVTEPSEHPMNKGTFALVEINKRPTLEGDISIHPTNDKKCMHRIQIWETHCRFEDDQLEQTVREDDTPELYAFVVPLVESDCKPHSSGGTGHLGQAHTHTD